ncbi:MAG TPA: AAA family ATPase [Methanocorpusculum sp.]|nr:AAA family ATPase [Methanocorpusculum sp.]HJK01903.1 AAA family ATPase [Methanocorpusculum sp.]
MRITISGLPGSGTTSLAKALAERYDLRYLSAGEVFRCLAKENGMDLASFGKFAEENPEIDLKIDARQKEIGETSDDIILEGRLAGWMVENADLKILLYASPGCRAERIAERENLSSEEASVATVDREASEAARYMEYYEIDIADLSPYDIVINSETFNQEEVLAIAETLIEMVFSRIKPV